MMMRRGISPSPLQKRNDATKGRRITLLALKLGQRHDGEGHTPPHRIEIGTKTYGEGFEEATTQQGRAYPSTMRRN
jgi:hypothetical protein